MDFEKFETIAKYAFSGGVAIFVIDRIITILGKIKLKKRLTKELAFEFFFNERIAEKIIKDFQNLRRNPCEHLMRHKFKTQVISRYLSPEYFVSLDSNLTDVVFEFDLRFQRVQYELNSFFKLEDDQKTHPLNLAHLEAGELDSRLLLDDLIKLKKLKELKKKYYKKWIKQRMKRMEERYNKKINKKNKKLIIKEEMKKISK